MFRIPEFESRFEYQVDLSNIFTLRLKYSVSTTNDVPNALNQ